MELIVKTIVFKESYEGEWKLGLKIGSLKSLREDGSVFVDAYFALEPTKTGVFKIVPFQYKDKFEIGYHCNDVVFKI